MNTYYFLAGFIVISYLCLIIFFFQKNVLVRLWLLFGSFLAFFYTVGSLWFTRTFSNVGTPFKGRDLLEDFVEKVYMNNEWTIPYVVVFACLFAIVVVKVFKSNDLKRHIEDWKAASGSASWRRGLK